MDSHEDLLGAVAVCNETADERAESWRSVALVKE